MARRRPAPPDRLGSPTILRSVPRPRQEGPPGGLLHLRTEIDAARALIRAGRVDDALSVIDSSIAALGREKWETRRSEEHGRLLRAVARSLEGQALQARGDPAEPAFLDAVG